ncbi:hypothetical protein KBK19_05595 [Microvirga sp. STR05]|uniref:Tissue inhibitor of metalloproteinase n=1 Tax=Hymenobacter duratus TaxID=2771356 RepID=A0ABR8JFE8_9BACT|nr:hypothetical protein [Hymenobacter duratus]MBD2714500.1 hypothetical protein [Hymenobacter duratus]MBR7949404.1 hypothetical protein [Microvirga sp. STR05]
MKTILLLLLSVLLHVSVAQACSCVTTGKSERQKIADAYRQDALIFVGRVVSIDTVTTTDTVRVSDTGPAAQQFQLIRHEKLRYTFAVARQFKGTATGPTVLVASEISSASCGKHFAVGSEQLVYAFLVTQKESVYGGELEDVTPYYATSLCNRSQELKSVKRAELKQLAKASK